MVAAAIFQLLPAVVIVRRREAVWGGGRGICQLGRTLKRVRVLILPSCGVLQSGACSVLVKVVKF